MADFCVVDGGSWRFSFSPDGAGGRTHVNGVCNRRHFISWLMQSCCASVIRLVFVMRGQGRRIGTSNKTNKQTSTRKHASNKEDVLQWEIGRLEKRRIKRTSTKWNRRERERERERFHHPRINRFHRLSAVLNRSNRRNLYLFLYRIDSGRLILLFALCFSL